MASILQYVNGDESQGMFGIIVEETTDICNKEQMSICIRYIDEKLVPIEVFMGFVETPSTTGKDLFCS